MARANVPHVISDDSALGGNLISGSLRFNKSNNSYLSRTFSGSSYDKQKKWTWSAWVKFGTVHQGVLFSGSPNCGGSRTCLYYENAQIITDVCGVGAYDQSSGLYRDSNAWYHIVWRFDTTNATAADRSRVYINGTEIPMSHPRTWSQNVGYGIGKNELHTMGVFSNSLTAGALDAQMAEVNFISELSLDPSHFGYTDSQTGTWRPKKYTGAYNTTGFYLPLNGSQHIGKDMSGNGCDWEPVKLSGTVPIGKATGAFPILKTNNGATVIHPGVRPDPYASNLVFATAISEYGIVASDVHHLIKGSGSAKSITNSSVSNSNDFYNSSHSTNFYGRSGSGYFNGSGAKLTVASSSDFALGTGDFTIELWFNKSTSNASEYLFDFGTNQLSMYFLSNNTLYYYANVGGSNTGNVEIGTVGVNEWNHVAAVRTSGVIKLYLNGQHIHTQNEPRNWSSAQTVTIGQYGGGGSYSFQGYIQDFRIYKGVAKYTDTFTCGAVDSSVIEDTPSGIAIPRTLDSHTGGSVALHTTANVSPDIIVASNSDLYLDGDFTIEFWIYLNSINNDTQHPSIITFPDNSGLGQVYINSSYNFYSLYWPSSDIVKTVDNGAQIGKWQYVTITRSSNSCRIFVDGVLGGSGYSGSHATATSSQAFGNSYGGLRIGGYTQNGGNVDGHISNLRIIKGTALYTSNFTPPTEPLTNVTGTSLLCFQSPTDVEAFTVDKNASTLNNKNWTRSGSFAWSIGADSNVTTKHRQFDGTIETGSAGAPNGNPGNVRFTFDSPITGITKCRLRTNTHNDAYQYRRVYYNGANGTYSIQTGSNTTAWHNVTSNVGNTLNWVEWGSYGGADADRGPYGLNGIEINDVLLTDRFRDNDGHGDKSSASHFSPFDNDIIQEGPSQYAVLNANAHTGVTLSNGSLTNTGGNDIPSNMGVKTGKFYAEISILTAYGSPNLKHLGVCATGLKYFRAQNSDSHIISELDSLMIRSDANGPYAYTGQSSAITSWTQVFNDTNIIFTNGDIVGIQLDMDNKFVKFYINGSLRTHYTFVTTSNFDKMYFFGRNNGSGKTIWNFGQKPFIYTPPSGFLPLASHNLESASILRPQRFFDSVLWTGNGGTSQTVNGLEFKPDFVWVKGRSNSAWHRLQNSVTGANKLMYSNATNQEAVKEANGYVSEFTEDGFKLADPDGNGGGVNSSGDTFVAWCWKGGSPETPTNGSAQFDADGDYLSLASTSDFDFGTGDFTLELYYRCDGYGNTPYMLEFRASGGSEAGSIVCYVQSSGEAVLWYNGSNRIVSNSVITLSKWTHIAYVRHSGTTKMYIDGVAQSQTYTDTNDYGDGGRPLFIGVRRNGGSSLNNQSWDGELSNVRIVKGTAVYTSNFTPSTTPLTNISNTKLLCCQSTTSATTAAVTPGTITANGGVTPSISNPFDAFMKDGIGYPTASAAGITEGSNPITGASINTKSGFSCFTYMGNGTSGATIGHGLGAAPVMAITKSRNLGTLGSAGAHWTVAHKGLTNGMNGGGSARKIHLSLTQAEGTNSHGCITAATSTTMTLTSGGGNDTDAHVNHTNGAYVCYCWTEIPGFSKFGRYKGNGNTNGPYIDCGFRPAFVMMKEITDASTNWVIYDNKRGSNTYNPVDRSLYPNLNNQEGDATLDYDFVSNGFKVRTSNGGINGNGNNYIFMAFAEQPEVTPFGSQSNAR